MALVFIILMLILLVLAYFGVQNPFVPIAFLTGGFFPDLCGYLGMRTATYASARTAYGASQSLNQGLQIAFRSGAVMGLVVVGFGLLDIAIWYLILTKLVYTTEHMANGLRHSSDSISFGPALPSIRKWLRSQLPCLLSEWVHPRRHCLHVSAEVFTPKLRMWVPTSSVK